MRPDAGAARGRMRGQATAELALGSLVFVTVVLFGIHFAEVGTMKLRVQQAGAFAMWNATQMRAHQLQETSSDVPPEFYNANQLHDGTMQTPQQAARARYADFNALSSGSSTLTWAATRGSRLRVTCQPTRVATVPWTTALGHLQPGYDYARAGGLPVDGISCGAEADIQIFGVPADFLDDSHGFFKVPHVKRPSMKVCAFGRADHGVCPGRMPLAIDDWGLAGNDPLYGSESTECDKDCGQYGVTGNTAYWMTIKRLYREWAGAETSRNWAISNFLKELYTKDPDAPWLMLFSPVDERDFRFAFMGEEHGFMMPTKEVGGAWNGGPTTVMYQDWAATSYSSKYRAAYAQRGECFLGVACDKSAFHKQSW